MQAMGDSIRLTRDRVAASSTAGCFNGLCILEQMIPCLKRAHEEKTVPGKQVQKLSRSFPCRLLVRLGVLVAQQDLVAIFMVQVSY